MTYQEGVIFLAFKTFETQCNEVKKVFHPVFKKVNMSTTTDKKLTMTNENEYCKLLDYHYQQSKRTDVFIALRDIK